jgi:hypothetical protein
MKTSVFCVIQDFPDYGVNENGVIMSFKTEKVIKPINHSAGYLAVCLYNNKIPKRFLVHRIVAKAFLPNPNNKLEVNHKNGDKKDNRLDNLEWVTSSENRKHAYKSGLQPINYSNKGKKFSEEVRQNMKKAAIGRIPTGHSREMAYKKTRKQIVDLLQGKTFPSINEAAKEFNMKSSTFSKAIRSKTHKFSDRFQIITIV